MMLRQAITKGVLLFFVIFTFLPSTVRAKVVEQLIAVVDGEPFTLTNLSTYAKSKMDRQFPTGDLSSINPSDREVLEQFLTEKLLESEIRDAGIKVSDQEIDQYIAQIKERNRLSDDDLKTALAREGQTLASYRASVKSELERAEIINRQVKKRVSSITNEDVERYYKQNLNKYRADERARLRLIVLLLPEKATADEVKAATAKATDLYKRIVAGEDFASLAREFSEGPGQSEGGDIGWVNRGTLISGLEDVAFQKLSVGQVSEPFRAGMGIQIVKLEARETGKVLPLSAVATKIKDELFAKALDERFNKWLKTDVRKKHHVDVKIPGVVFKAEDSKEGTVDALMAKSTKLNKKPDRSFLSYLNPFSYVSKETEVDEDDPKSPLYGKKIVSVLGVPMFSKDDVDDVPDVLAAPPPEAAPATGSSPSQSGGFFSSIVDTLNPFKK
jgi:peptidyl-prolyl cis-trans isomerase SurA